MINSLASELVQFYKDFDYYDYQDMLEIGENHDDAVAYINAQLEDKNSVNQIINTIQDIQNGDVTPEQKQTADTLIFKLSSLHNDTKSKMNIRIFQIHPDRDKSNAMYLSLAENTELNGSNNIDSTIYDRVFRGEISGNSLEDVFATFNFSRPDGFIGRSLSVSDVVEIYKKGTGSAFYYCDSIGFKEVQFNPQNCCYPELSSNKIKVLLVEPMKYPKVIEIENTLESMQKLIGGNIELLSPYEDEVSIICNEEGKITGLPLNRTVYTEPLTEMKYKELKEVFIEAEKNGKHLRGLIVFAQECFHQPLIDSARTYVISSDNKAFKPNVGGYSICGSSLDGLIKGARLEKYMSEERGGKNGWKIEKCYLVADEREMIEIVAGTFFVVGTPSDSDKFSSLTKEQIDKFQSIFKTPEQFYKRNNEVKSTPYIPPKSNKEEQVL